jgi:hypothetical protein
MVPTERFPVERATPEPRLIWEVTVRVETVILELVT